MGVYQMRLVFFREFGAMLNNPLYYVLSGVFFLLTSLIYLMMLADFARGSEDTTVNVTESVVRPTFHMVHYFLLVQIPLLTMRIFAEDQSNGMLDLLQTTPLSDWPLLLGKFLAAGAGISVYIGLTALFPVATAFLSDVEWPVVVGSLIALTLSSAGYIATGMFFSSLTDSQVVAAVLSYVTLFMLVFLHLLGASSQVPALAEAARHFAVGEHIEGLLSGNIAPMNVAYFICVTAIFLFLTARILESRRWRS